MPELPEVETITRQLAPELTDAVFGMVRVSRDDIIHGDPRPLPGLLCGRRVDRVHRRAKRVMMDLSGGVQLVFHLGMTGRLTMTRVGSAIDPHTHLQIRIRGTDRELRFRDPRRFGGVWCLTDQPIHIGQKLGPLGPEPLDLRIRQFKVILRRSRLIKALLLDQTAVAGLGNIYCDESLHAAGIHPLTPADSLDGDAAWRLLRCIKSTLRRAIRFNGTTMMDYRTPSGATGSFRRFLRVYGREGEPCRRCGTSIERIIVAGRSSFFCSQCQRRPGGRGRVRR
jgi:formamidopyrimidine-DNA glycosylase